MIKNTSFFKRHNISSAIIFYGIVLFYTLYIDVAVNAKTIFTILFFTIVFWLANSLQSSRK